MPEPTVSKHPILVIFDGPLLKSQFSTVSAAIFHAYIIIGNIWPRVHGQLWYWPVTEQGNMGMGENRGLWVWDRLMLHYHPGLLRGAPAALLCPQYYVWLPCLDVFQDTSSFLAASTESYKTVNCPETAICQPFPQSHWQINSSICCLVQGCWMGSWGEPWIKATIKILQLIRSPVPLFSLVPKTAKQSFGFFFYFSWYSWFKDSGREYEDVWIRAAISVRSISALRQIYRLPMLRGRLWMLF